MAGLTRVGQTPLQSDSSRVRHWLTEGYGIADMDDAEALLDEVSRRPAQADLRAGTEFASVEQPRPCIDQGPTPEDHYFEARVVGGRTSGRNHAGAVNTWSASTWQRRSRRRSCAP